MIEWGPTKQWNDPGFSGFRSVKERECRSRGHTPKINGANAMPTFVIDHGRVTAASDILLDSASVAEALREADVVVNQIPGVLDAARSR